MQRSAEPRIPGPNRQGKSGKNSNSGELRVTAADRPGGGSSGRKSAPKRAAKSGKPRSARRSGSARRKAKARRGGLFSMFRRLVYWCLVLGIWGGIGIAGLVGWHFLNLPSDTDLSIPERPPNIRIVAIDGSVVGNRGETGGEEVRLFELPAYVPQAVMAIEDRRFYNHFGIDPLGLARAVVVNVSSGRFAQGGSTLTQQLAKNLFLNPERTLTRKVQELGLAFWLEYTYSKDEILEMYLNRVYLGAGAYGVEAAARRYYDKSARDLSLSEAAMIAGLLKAPSRYAPTRNPERAARRARTVIAAMEDAGFISAQEARYARENKASVQVRSRGGSMNYVADMVAREVTQFIGAIDGDIVVDTTIDPQLQLAAEESLNTALDKAGKDKKAGQGAVVLLDPYGAIRALVGGRNHQQSPFNRAVDAKRQPGSAFKPFVYLAAIERGVSPVSRRVDEPVRIGKYTPANYDGEYRGPVTLADALASSVNTVAVRLADEVQAKSVVAVARKMGIRSKLDPNLSIALGTSEVTLEELTGAYVPFSNGGYGVLPHVIRRIRTIEGDVLYERSGSGPGQVMSPDVVGKMNYMMARTVNEGTAKRARLDGHPAAGKTGTTQSYRDAWFIGYTATYTAGVWIGNDDASPMKKVTGGSLPAQVWHDLMTKAHEGLPVVDLPGGYVPEDNNGQLIADGTLPWRNEDRPVANAAGEAVRQVSGGIAGLFDRIFGR